MDIVAGVLGVLLILVTLADVLVTVALPRSARRADQPEGLARQLVGGSSPESRRAVPY